ncbi:SNF5-domain-containing protein [Rickenella mellea]|uniref:SNF5-domain-containing protein n=1 Tax=Rickenella mellea TaxID=50990 RepID=A0A4Y7Q5S6_9AGAM|nr:SNF5-domain-containing protein [Rickenella mellea]
MPDTPGTYSFQANFGSMTDSQLRQTISQLSSAAQTTYGAYRPPPPPLPPQPGTPTHSYASSPAPLPQPSLLPTGPSAPPNPPRAPLPVTSQALHTTYASRLRTGTTLLMQPILATASSAVAGGRIGTRRGGIINYAEPGSGDEMDAGAVDTDDSDFVASGGTRTALRSTRSGRPAFHSFQATGSGTPVPQGRQDLDQSYLGMIPPSRFISAKHADATKHEYPSQETLEKQAALPSSLVPIRVEFETDTHRVRDCFVWNLHEQLIKPELFARTLCADLDLPINQWAETVANQIRAQIEEHEGVASMDLGTGIDVDEQVEEPGGDELPECRVILSIDVQIATYHLLDHIEWDLLSPLTPEHFAQRLCADIGLAGEAAPLVAHALHEEILRHKKDAIEWGVIGFDTNTVPPPAPTPSVTANINANNASAALEDVERDKDKKSGLGLMKDKTGLGLGGWGRAPRDGRGPKALRSVWKDWSEAEDLATRFEVLTAEEVERREIERERASRRLRRETSKFQYQSTGRRRR